MQYLEPRTDVPAKDDWSTAMSLRQLRGGYHELTFTTVIAAVILLVAWNLPMTVGNIATIVVLSVLLLLAVIEPLRIRARTRARRRGLLDEPWRRLPATVAKRRDDDPDDHLLLDDVVLTGVLMGLPDMVLERQEVFVCGPDSEGKAVVRAAGYAEMHNAEVKTGEYEARERVERSLGRPLDDPAVERASIAFRWGRWAGWWVAGPAVIGGVLVLLSLFPVAPAGLVAGGLLLASELIRIPGAIQVGRWNRAAGTALGNSAEWTPVPVTLLPWTSGRHVTGLAQLPDGTVPVRFPVPDLDVIANIADTGIMWIAGTHDDVLAVGVPGVSSVMAAVVRPDQDTSMPWYERLRQPAYSGLPS